MIAWLEERDAEELRALLLRDPVENLFLLGLLEDHGITGRYGGPAIDFLGIRDRTSHRLKGAVFIGGQGRLIVPSCADPADALAAGRFLAGRYRPGSVVGRRAAADALWRGLDAPWPRLYRDHQLFVLTPDGCGPHVAPALRLATADDLEAVVELARALHREELDRDPGAGTAAEAFRRRCADRIAAGRSWVLEAEGTIAFRAEVGTRCRQGAQIEGVYTAPAFRGRGLATRAIGQLGRLLLGDRPRVTLHAAVANAPAVALYRRVGFVPALPFRLIVAE
jgi:predicted GNAT family acetyltransferase